MPREVGRALSTFLILLSLKLIIVLVWQEVRLYIKKMPHSLRKRHLQAVWLHPYQSGGKDKWFIP